MFLEMEPQGEVPCIFQESDIKHQIQTQDH